MTYVIIGGNFDLSVGSLLSLCSVVCISLHDSIGPVPAMIATILVGCASGILSGYLVGYLKLNSMIVTLGMMNVLQAAALMWTNGKFVEQYLLQDGRLELAEVYTQPEDYLTEEERAAYITEFKCSLYDDLLIKLADIFDRVE